MLNWEALVVTNVSGGIDSGNYVLTIVRGYLLFF